MGGRLLGKRALGSVPRNYGPTVPLLGALGVRGLEAIMTVEGATDGAILHALVAQGLGPPLAPGDIVVMANWRAHKVAGLQEALEGCGAQLISLPPSSPELAPIARCWSKLKTVLRGLGTPTREALERAVEHALGNITAADALAWFACSPIVGIW
jgi:transposase